MMSSREKVLATSTVLLLLLIAIGGVWVIGNKPKADAPAVPDTTTTTTTTTSASTTSGKVFSEATLTLKPGYNLVSVPFILSPNNGSTLFEGLNNREAYYYDTKDSKWTSFYTNTNALVTPGQGIWLKSERGESYTIPVAASPVDITKPYTISLQKGWNAIGNPFPKDITWEPSVRTKKGTTSFKKAVEVKILSAGYISNPATKEYQTVQAGDVVSAFEGIMIQSGGDDIELIISPTL